MVRAPPYPTRRANACSNMASQNPWEWDEARQEYYYWDAVSECYVYQHSGPVSPEGTAYQSPQGSAQANVQTNVEDGPPERITEAGALQSGINAHKKIRETPGDREMLDPRKFDSRPWERKSTKSSRIPKALSRQRVLQSRQGIQGPLAGTRREPAGRCDFHHWP